jgi:NarL family two-component system response regulator LiaR
MPTSKSIRILIADDHAVVREGLRSLLSAEPEMQVIGEAADGEQAVERVRALRPDVVLLDLMMPRRDGLAVIPELKREDPNVRILMVSSFADAPKVLGAIKAGALGYVLKDASPAEILAAVREVAQGNSSLPMHLARSLIVEIGRPADVHASGDRLSAREVDVLRLVARGLRNEEIAETLAISVRTVGRHVSNVLEKLELANRTQAALYALREGLAQIEMPPPGPNNRRG